jgi:SAM-dependent methyltransferase
MYTDVIASLRRSYANDAPARNQRPLPAWKIDERQRVLSAFQEASVRRLLEIGAGPGRDSLYFQEQGLQVTCTDLSPEMVALCRAKGLTAHEMDFLNLDFPPQSFDAVYAMNCLLHVPKADLPAVLAQVQRLLRPDGLIYIGIYGGYEHEGIWAEDSVQPNRFFAFYTDEQIQAAVAAHIDNLDFRTIAVEAETDLHFQALMGRSKQA